MRCAACGSWISSKVDIAGWPYLPGVLRRIITSWIATR
jgi:hypothetical protein